MRYAAVIICFFVIFFIIRRYSAKKLTEGYLSSLMRDERKNDGTLTASVLSVTMPKGRVFSSLSLPIPGKDGEEIHLGTVVVNRCGVFILCQINGTGLIENPPENKWKYISGGKYAEFDNPFRAQEGARNLIEYYAKKAGIPGVRAHSIVVYTDDTLRFSQPLTRSVIALRDLRGRLCSLDKLGRMTDRQVKDVCRVLREIGEGVCVY